jgi:hypothetical protein
MIFYYKLYLGKVCINTNLYRGVDYPIAMTRNPAEREFDARLSTIIKGLNNEILNGLRSISKENASIIVDYISAMITEINPSDSYKGSTIHLLYSLSKYNKNKSFRSITRDEVIHF